MHSCLFGQTWVAVRHFLSRDRVRPFDMLTEPQITTRSLRRRGVDLQGTNMSFSDDIKFGYVVRSMVWWRYCLVLSAAIWWRMQTSFTQPLQNTHRETTSHDNLAVGSLKWDGWFQIFLWPFVPSGRDAEFFVLNMGKAYTLDKFSLQANESGHRPSASQNPL